MKNLIKMAQVVKYLRRGNQNPPLTLESRKWKVDFRCRILLKRFWDSPNRPCLEGNLRIRMLHTHSQSNRHRYIITVHNGQNKYWHLDKILIFHVKRQISQNFEWIDFWLGSLFAHFDRFLVHIYFRSFSNHYCAFFPFFSEHQPVQIWKISEWISRVCLGLYSFLEIYLCHDDRSTFGSLLSKEL